MIEILLELQETKDFLKYSFNEDDLYIQELILTSEDYLIDSIGLENYNSKIHNERFRRKARLCCRIIIHDCYDNREFVTKENEKLRIIISGILLQMKYGMYE
ncbi:head-tail connector protein [Clostridium tagluense]|uniref:head-tail connector protein n=1 Tax=Clostridium tagluense TaxID=360422 RepID=UPI001CF11AFE|nr:head-tail connector protein [Clostridium tagluense]MCB2300651.1 head-tail connector protein [Clostridium tagluense]